MKGCRDDGGCYPAGEKRSWEGKVTLKLAGEGHKVVVFLGSRKHNRLSCFNSALQSWIKYCKWCCTGTRCTKRCTEHAVCPVPHRDCLRLTGEKEYTCKTSHKSEIQHHLRHYHPHSKQLVLLTFVTTEQWRTTICKSFWEEFRCRVKQLLRWQLHSNAKLGRRT